jgi:hypothetical protein
MGMARPILAVVFAALLAGCGGGAGQDDAPVRALMDRYLQALTHHDWVRACAQLTPQAAKHRRLSAPAAADCPSAQAFEAGAGLVGVPHVHPERAGEELATARIDSVVMRGDSAQIFITVPPDRSAVPYLAVRRAGRWLLAQDLEIGVPVDAYSGTLY